MPQTEITYTVRMLGRMWMPNCLAAMDEHYSRDRYPFTSMTPRPAWNNRAAELDAIEEQATMGAGDFSSIEDMEITRTVTVTRPDENGGTVRQSATRVLRAWRDEESELAYYDCFAEDA